MLYEEIIAGYRLNFPVFGSFDPDGDRLFKNITMANMTDPDNVVSRTITEPDFFTIFPFISFDPLNMNAEGLPAITVFADERFLGKYLVSVNVVEVFTYEHYTI